MLPSAPGRSADGCGGTDDAQAIATIKSAINLGITLIDTAPADGFGHAEELVGRALAEAGSRDKVYIATKVGQCATWTVEAIRLVHRQQRLRTLERDALPPQCLHSGA